MAKKKTKGNGEGTIYKTDNGWRGQIHINGNRISARGKTKQEVVDRLSEAKVDANRGMYVDKNNITVDEWVKEWLKSYVEPKITEASYIKYEALFRNHLYPVLGKYKLQELTKPVLEEAYGKMFQKKLKESDNNAYSHSTVNALAVLFKKCLGVAVSNGILYKNPHIGVELNKLRPPKKVEAYTLDEQKRIIEYLNNSIDLYKLFYFLLTTRMRIGEATALTWDDIDFNNNTININKTVVELRGHPQIENRTKTNAGTRKIVTISKTMLLLKDIRDNQMLDLNVLNLVFPSTRYTIRTQANLGRLWKRVCTDADVPHKGMHSLRHTWATRALENDIDVKTVSAMLGHKNVVTTMNIYQDVLQDHQQDSILKINNIF